MSLLGRLLVVSLCLQVSWAYSRFRGRPPRCVKITNQTAPLCENLSDGYDEMMLPNLLGHDTVKEVKQELGQWSPLVGSGCHPHLKHFLCSVFAPVCMVNQPPIGPCRSLCSSVQKSCEPLMKMHNYSWPMMLNCSRYKQNEMCVDIPAPTTPTRPRSVCIDDDSNAEKKLIPMLKKAFCEADFSFRGRVQERKDRKNVVILKFKVSSHSKYLKRVKAGQNLRVRVPGNAQCKGKQYLVFGKQKGKGKYIATYILKWKKWRKFIRKFNKKSCRKY